jgi:hypothetical protein
MSEEDLKADRICPYCKRDCKDEPIDSTFDFEKLYKEVECTGCGKTLHFKAGFDGSGHDHLNGDKKKETKPEKTQAKKEETFSGVKTIESKIRLLDPT